MADDRLSLVVISGAPEPYSAMSGGGFSAPAVPDSPDPLVAYRWPAPKAADGLQIYALKPASATPDVPTAFSQLDSLTGEHPNVTVSQTGSIRMDFGQENAGWLEFDSPDLDGTVEMSISEYNEPAIVSVGPAHYKKTAVPTKYGNTYRLELNRELYEGVRFGWIHVRSFNKPWHITGLRLVCQTKPCNYTGSFSCNDPELTRIWYTGVYTVKMNLTKDYFGAILMDRGDRFSWTGDAYPAQGAAFVSLGNLDFVKANLKGTSTQSNGIASYSLYWVLSLIDYYNYSSDGTGLDEFIDNACGKLDTAYKHFDHPPHLEFFGWEERIGAGFENSDIPESKRAYAMLSIRAWRDFARAMEQHGRLDLRDKYLGYANEKSRQLRKDPDWLGKLGVHAAADAVNAGFATPDEQQTLYANRFNDRVARLSYSPFNEYFILQAMSAMNRTDDGLSIIKDCWGGQIRYGGTSFFEVYDPSWNAMLGKNDAVPNEQAGYTSLCHPWGAGVVKWLTEETLGIKPTSPGFKTYTVCPHLGRTLTRVSGQVQTPHGLIVASFDTETGKCSLTAPPDTVGELCIPKVEKRIASIRINGKPAWNGTTSGKIAGISAIEDEADSVRLKGVQPGHYDIDVSYTGTTPAKSELAWNYPVAPAKEDATTQGNWGGKYGHDGFVLCSYDEPKGKPTDRRTLPDYLASVRYSLNKTVTWQTGTNDVRAPASDATNSFPRNAGCIYTQDPQACLETMKVDINFSEAKPRLISLYFVDWDKKDRRLAVELFDRATLQRLAPVQMVRDFAGGKYLVYRIDRSVRFRIDSIRGDNAALSAIFFDPADSH